MSTKATIRYHDGSAGTPSWHLYEEVFEEGVVYLELDGVNVELAAVENGARLVVRLSIDTAEQLGLCTTSVRERWAAAHERTADAGDESTVDHPSTREK